MYGVEYFCRQLLQACGLASDESKTCSAAREDEVMVEKPKVQTPAKLDPSPETHQTPPRETDGDIASRAFELFCERGSQDGFDVEDWLQAERELQSPASSTA